MTKKLLTTLGLIIIVLTIFSPLVANALTIPDELRPINEPFAGVGDELEVEGAAYGTVLVLQIIAGGLLYFAAPIAVILIANTAFTMVTGGADSEKIEQAKKSLTWTIIGLLLIILSYSIVRFVIGLIIESASKSAA